MSEHLPREQIERYRSRWLSPRATVAVDLHLDECASCRAKVYERDDVPQAFDSLRASLKNRATERGHITYEEKKAYVRRQADELEREMIEGHINVCSGCAAEIESLSSLAALMDSDAARGATPGQSFWNRVAAFFSNWSALKAASAAAVVLIAAFMSITFVLVATSKKGDVTENMARATSPAPAQSNAAPRMAMPQTLDDAKKSAGAALPGQSATIMLSQSSKRGEAKQFPISRASSSVRIGVVVGQAEYKRYRGVLVAGSGKTIELGAAEVDGSGKIIFNPIPTGPLSSGDYQLRLIGMTGDTSSRQAGNYNLRIVKQ